MKLDDFIKEKAFKKYANGIDSIREEFETKGYEKFLWRKYSEESFSKKQTTEFIMHDGEFIPNANIVKFLEQFNNVNWEREAAFIFPESLEKNFFIAKEVSKKAKYSYIIQNIFDEDDTVNWLCVFDKEKVNDIMLMYHLVYSSCMGDSFGGYKLFGKGLMYYVDTLEYKGIVLGKDGVNLLAHFQGNTTRRDTNPYKIVESRKVIKMITDLQYFKNELELFRNFYELLLPYMQKWYEDVERMLENVCYDWKEEKTRIYNELIISGVIHSKWKSEQTLFKLVQKEYDDAIFQYRPQWLIPQSLDIYIPTLKTGIEYQGIQHYMSIDYFGGEEAFLHRKKLDNIKREKCREKGVRLIEWNYNEEISKQNLYNKIK